MLDQTYTVRIELFNSKKMTHCMLVIFARNLSFISQQPSICLQGSPGIPGRNGYNGLPGDGRDAWRKR